MPVTLAMLAIERSISAQRITKVSPTAMMPVTDTWVRMLPTLSSVAKEGLAAAKNPVRKMSVRKGAILRIWARKSAPIVGVGLGTSSIAEPFTLSSSVASRRLEQAVLAHRLVREFAHHRAPLEHDNAIGKGKHRLRLRRNADDGKAPRPQTANEP